MRSFCQEENLASIQAGMLEALLAAGIRPDVLVGTSIGAANAAFLAADPSAEERGPYPTCGVRSDPETCSRSLL